MMPTPYQDDPRRRRPVSDYALGDPNAPMDADGFTNKASLENRGLVPGALPQPSPQLLTPQNQQAITRPRTVGNPLSPPPVNMPQPDTSGVDAPNGGVPTGLNSVGQALAKYGPHYAYGPAHVDEQGHQVGTVPGTSRKSHLEALGLADPTSSVTQTPEGWQIDPAHERGKGYGVLHGLLQGALQGIATTGKWQGALGGAATGAAAGGISPKLLQGLERHQETTREQGQYDRELGNQAKEQTLGVQRSQIEENLAQAERARSGPRQIVQDDAGGYRSISQDTGLDTQGRPVKGKDPDATTAYQQGQLGAADARNKETARYHDQMIAQRKADRAARLAIAKHNAASKPSPAAEANVRALVEEGAEDDALERRHTTDAQIAKLRDQRDKLTHRSVQNADGSWGWEEDMGASLTSKTSVAALDKQIADLQKESDNQQRIAETAAQNKRAAEAKATAGGQPPKYKNRRGGGSDLDRPIKGKPTSGGKRGSGKAFNLGAWITDHPNEDAAAKRTQLTADGYTITE